MLYHYQNWLVKLVADTETNLHIRGLPWRKGAIDYVALFIEYLRHAKM